ncbi:MAG: type II CRISPR RNA-guided endonuclease Cas9 [Bacteroidales bacterium]|nr:type II CRISPR RNA-guided endonuclease Cas9 [Bacteroidales bacterium]
MKKVLGLDLGITSIGWALVNEKENDNEKSSIIKLGVRLNPLTVDEQNKYKKGESITTNADRRKARSIRRNLQRYKLRRERLKEALLEHGIVAPDTPLYEAGPRSTFETLRNRAKAATDEIPLEDFGRVLLMLNGKRGYKSNRKLKDAIEGKMIDGMDVAKLLRDRNLTPGQYLLELFESQQRRKVAFYRSDLQSEFDRIYGFQSTFYSEILTEGFKQRLNGLSRGDSSAEFRNVYQIDTAKNSGTEAYEKYLRWRTSAIHRQIDIEKLAYVLCAINGDINSSSDYLGMIGDRSKELIFNGQTVGQRLMDIIEQRPGTSLKNIVFYRQDYLREFDTLWETQAKFHPQLTDALQHKIRDEIIFYQRPLKSCKGLVNFCELEHEEREVTKDGKTKTVTIGSKVCPKSSPLFQEFKIWQMLNDVQVSLKGSISIRSKKQLKVSTDSETYPRFLTQDEKQILHKELCVREQMKKGEALKRLFTNHQELDMNFSCLEGNRTMAAFYVAFQEIISLSGHGEYEFAKMDASKAERLVEDIFKGLGWNTDFLSFSPIAKGKELERQSAYRLWHLIYSYAGDNSVLGNEALVRRISELFIPLAKDGIPDEEREERIKAFYEYARILADVTLQDGYGRLSAKAIRRILPYMMQGYGYSEACEEAGYKHSSRSLTKEELVAKSYSNHLKILPRNSLRNPVVEKILNQMINVVNELSATYGKPDEIRIELARELKQSKEERDRAVKSIQKNTVEGERIRNILEKEFRFPTVSRNDILRFRLYEELKDNGYHTLYSHTYIPKEKIFSKEFDIEHIIPQSRLFDDSFSNKTLEARKVNLEKGNRTAYDYVASKGMPDLQAYQSRVEELFKNGGISQTKRDNLLRKEADIPSDFLERDLRNSQYIVKKACEILENMVPTVVVTIGSITSRLREDWQLVDVMQELNMPKYESLGLTELRVDKDGRCRKVIKDWTKRNDHRHHAMDALTIAFTTSSIIQYLNNLNAHSDKSSGIYRIEQKISYRNDKGKLRFLPPMPLDEFRIEAKRQLENILVSVKAKNKVVTCNVNKTKFHGGYKSKEQLTPRGRLHEETVYGKIRQYKTEEVKVGGNMTKEVIIRVCDKRYRNALLQRLTTYGGDAKKAFTGKNALDKNPIYLDVAHSSCVPERVRIARYEDVMTITAKVDPDLNVEKVIDVGLRRILQKRLEEYGGDPKKAFVNLDTNPIWQNKEKGIAIKRIKIRARLTSEAQAIRCKHDAAGQVMHNDLGGPIPADFVKTGDNHHVSIFKDADGNWQEHVVSFFEATTNALLGLPIVDKEYHKSDGWQFVFSMKKNEYFVFPNAATGFNPSEIDLLDPKNAALISPNLYRVQKFSSKYYVFRHHLETNVQDVKELKDIAWKRITAIRYLNGVVKVRVNHIGQIVAVGEY